MNGYITITRSMDELKTPRFDVVEVPSYAFEMYSLSKLQEVVGGLIEAAFTVPSPFRPNVSITAYVNEEGRIIGLPVYIMAMLPHGRQSFAGDMVVVGLDELTGGTVLLREDELRHVEDVTMGLGNWLVVAPLVAGLTAQEDGVAYNPDTGKWEPK